MKYKFVYLWNRPPQKHLKFFHILHHPFPLPSSLQNQFLRFFPTEAHTTATAAPVPKTRNVRLKWLLLFGTWPENSLPKELPNIRDPDQQVRFTWTFGSWDIAIEITYPTSSPLDLIFVHGGWLLHQDSKILSATIMAESDHVQNLYALFKGSCWKNWSSKRDCRVELAILVIVLVLNLIRWFLEIVCV